MCSLSAGCWWSLTCFRDQVGSRLESQTSMTFAYSSCSVLHPENYEMLKCLFQTERTTGLSGHFYIHTEHHLQYMYNLQNMVNIPDTLFLVFPSYIRVALIPAPSGRGTKRDPNGWCGSSRWRYPKWPLFLKVGAPQNTAFSDPKKGHLGSRCVYVVFIYIYIYMNILIKKIYIYRNIYHISSSFSLVPIIFKFCPGLSVSNECSRRRVPTHHDQLIRKCPIATSILWWTTGALVCNYG